MVKCTKCPSAYHVGDHCLPAGSIQLNNANIVCPEHFKPLKNQANHSRVNVTWCFVCTKTGGDLIGCNKCPAVYHVECAPNPPEPSKTFDFLTTSTINQESNNDDEHNNSASSNSTTTSSNKTVSATNNHSPQSNVSASTQSSSKSIRFESNWTCEDCLFHKRPLYGDIVWSKVGSYRWWPGQICLPRSLPENLQNTSRINQVGEFAVRFFGSNDYSWVHLGRCFVFAEGDDESSHSGGGSGGSRSKSLIASYKKSVLEAKLAFKKIEQMKRDRQGRLTSTNATKINNFTFIKTNKIYGNVNLNRLPLNELQKCDCDETMAAPCSSDTECVNRVLKYECKLFS